MIRSLARSPRSPFRLGQVTMKIRLKSAGGPAGRRCYRRARPPRDRSERAERSGRDSAHARAPGAFSAARIRTLRTFSNSKLQNMLSGRYKSKVGPGGRGRAGPGEAPEDLGCARGGARRKLRPTRVCKPGKWTGRDRGSWPVVFVCGEMSSRASSFDRHFARGRLVF